MRINSSLNNKVIFSSNMKKGEHVTKSEPKKYSSSVNSFASTSDYSVKIPQRYTKIDSVKLPDNLTANVYKLESGQKVVIVPKDGPTVIKTYVNTGAFNEKDSERGISHFVEHSLFNGSDGLDEGEFFNTVNKMGANTNASTSFSATDYYIKSNLLKFSDIEKQIKIHSSMLETPKFSNKMIEKEKGPVTSEISMILDDMENVAVNTTIKNLFNIKTTSEDVIGGTIDNINNLTREKVLDYYNANYFPSNMVTVITGDVDEKNVIKLVSKYMQSRKEAPKNRQHEILKPIEKTVRKDIISDKYPSTFISIGFNGPENSNIKDKIIFDAVGYLLTDSTLSRINRALEDIQSEADITLERLSSKSTDNTAILLTAQTNEKNCETAIDKINFAISSLINNPPTEDDINVIKKNLKIAFYNCFDNSHDINSMIGTSLLDGDLSNITDYNRVIDSLTSEDFSNFASKYLNPLKQSITIIHPKLENKISFGGRKPINTENINVKTLDNNILLVENASNKNVVYSDLKLTNNIENINVPASLILSELLERGTKLKFRDEYFNDLEKDGISLGFFANYNSINISSECMRHDIKKTIDNIKEVLLNPRFTKEDFDVVKKQLIQNFSDIPPSAQDYLYSELFKGLPKGITNKELLEGIHKVTLDDVKILYKKLISDAQLKATVSGPFYDNNFKADVETSLGSDFLNFQKFEINDKSSFKPVENSKLLIQEHNKSQAEIMLGYKFKINDNSPEKMVRYTLLNLILGGTASSRLFNDLRETQKLAYNVKSFLDYNDSDTGVCNLYIKTTTEDKNSFKNIEKSITGFQKHIKKLINENVTKEELENAKLVLKNRIYNDNETVKNKNASLLSNISTKTGIELTNKVMNIIDDISVDDLKNAAFEIFSNVPVYSIVAKKDALSYNQKFLDNLV